MKCFFARDMWAPDIVFGNQVSLERAVSTIKNKAEAVVEVLVLDCPEKESEALCEDLGLAGESKSTKIMLKQTARLEVNCPDMDFADFPFDNQFCDFIPFGVKQDEDGAGDIEWDTFQLVKGKNLTSTEYDLQVRGFWFL